MNIELKEESELKPVERPVLRLTIGLDGEEAPYQLVIGDPEHKVTKAETWMLEVCLVGIELLTGALKQLESNYLSHAIKQGREARKVQKEIKENWDKKLKVEPGKEN